MKKIIISDISSRVEYSLSGDSLEMVRSGGCQDALRSYGCPVSESMDDHDIEEWVYTAWCDSYAGDPEANGLTVIVQSA